MFYTLPCYYTALVRNLLYSKTELRIINFKACRTQSIKDYLQLFYLLCKAVIDQDEYITDLCFDDLDISK